MKDVLILGIIFSVPLSAILGAYWVRIKRLDAEGGGAADARLRALEAEARELRARVEVLETIATSDHPKGRVRVEPATPEAQEVPAAASGAARGRGGAA
jgi:hypothetical protein